MLSPFLLRRCRVPFGVEKRSGRVGDGRGDFYDTLLHGSLPLILPSNKACPKKAVLARFSLPVVTFDRFASPSFVYILLLLWTLVYLKFELSIRLMLIPWENLLFLDG